MCIHTVINANRTGTAGDTLCTSTLEGHGGLFHATQWIAALYCAKIALFRVIVVRSLSAAFQEISIENRWSRTVTGCLDG